jgi:O-antigen/teichoic acid export membrane protein
MVESRIRKTSRNIQVALVYYFINLLLNLFSRKVFIDHLGTEVLGLNTTATNLLGFLNIAELGIGAAISYSLYTPLFKKDKQVICEILSVQGWLYRKVAYKVILGAIVLMCFFPLIFAKADVPMWYTYTTFSVLLFSSLLGYFVNYRQIILTADQKDYKITINLKGFTIIKVILQIIAIAYLSNGYMYWLVLEVVTAIAASIALNRLIKREYPWLITFSNVGYSLRKKHSDIILKTKQLFTHKIASFTLSQTTPLIIYAYATLTLVAIYGNYMLIISGITALSNALFNSITAGVGSLVAEGNKEKIMNLFWNLTSFRFWLASVFCFSFYTLSHPFISLWIGEEYILPQTPFLLLTIYLFFTQTRVCDIFLNAYGLYKDIGAPLIEAVLNIGCSILLGYFFGLSGVITGVLISLLIVVNGWKPFFLFKNAFGLSSLNYFKHYSKYIFLILISIALVYLICKVFKIDENSGNIIFLGGEIFIYMICSIFLFLLFNKDFKHFFIRYLNL